LKFSQACFGVCDFGKNGISVLPEIEEFFIVLNGFARLFFFLIQLGQPVIVLGWD